MRWKNSKIGIVRAMMLEACSIDCSSEDVLGKDEEENKKEQVNWKKLKLEAEIWDLLS
jgi:hypothetical protein